MNSFLRGYMSGAIMTGVALTLFPDGVPLRYAVGVAAWWLVCEVIVATWRCWCRHRNRNRSRVEVLRVEVRLKREGART